MCNGSIMDKLISFSLPLMLSGILQLMFNAVDIIVVGRFSGKQALAAVGSTTALINVFTNLFIGISLGANVLAARFYAMGKSKEMSETVHTSITLAMVSGVIMAFVGVLFARGALELMGTPDDVIDQSTLYMRIPIGSYSSLQPVKANKVNNPANNVYALFFLIIYYFLAGFIIWIAWRKYL